MASIAQVKLADPPRSRRSGPDPADLGSPRPTDVTTTMTTTTTNTTNTTNTKTTTAAAAAAATETDQNQSLAAFEEQMQVAAQILTDLIRARKTVPDAIVKECRDEQAQAVAYLFGVQDYSFKHRPRWTSLLLMHGKIREKELKLRRFVASVKTSFEGVEKRCGEAEGKLAGIRDKAAALAEDARSGPWAIVCRLRRRLEADRDGCTSDRVCAEAPREGEPSRAAVMRAHVTIKVFWARLGQLVRAIKDEEARLREVREKYAFVVPKLDLILGQDFSGMICGLEVAVYDVKAVGKSVGTEKKKWSKGGVSAVVAALSR